MEKQFIHNENDLSVEEVNAMIEVLDDMMYHLEQFNELLSDKIRERHPIFCQFLRGILISNSNAVKYTIQVKSVLEETIANYLDKADDSFTGHT